MTDLLNIDSNIQLTSSEKILLDFIKSNPKKVIHGNLQFLCDQLYISNATIVRFCQKLGFNGFNEFKFELHKQLNNNLSNNLVINDIFDSNLAIFKDHLSNLPLDKIKEIYNLLNTYPIIYIYGSAMSSIPAHYLQSVLASLDYQCIFVEWRHLLKGIAQHTNQKTLLILMTSHGSPERYDNIIKKLAENQTKIVTITDEHNDLFANASTIYINTEEANEFMHDIDYSYKLQSLNIVQILIELLYSNTDNKQQ